MSRRFRRMVLWSLGLIALAVGAVALLATLTKLPGEELTPSGLRRNTAIYVKMRDGVQLAADVWLPQDYQTGQRLPVLLRTTRSGRESEYGWAFRLLVGLKLTKPHGPGNAQTDYLNGRHFVVVVADARGRGASGGNREVEFSAQEISDLGELVHWASQQPWSSGRIGTFGNYYEGTAAELAAASNVPALKAVAAFSSPFDAGMQLLPGGLHNQAMERSWTDQIRKLDHMEGDVCLPVGLHGLRRWWVGRMVRGVKRVDDDHDGTQLAAILAQRHNNDSGEPLSRVEFRDDHILLSGGKSTTLAEISPAGHQSEIIRSRVALQIWCGWLDGGVCEGALSRYLTLKNPQEVIMGPFSHNLQFNTDPFLATSRRSPPEPSSEDQQRMMADFFERILRTEGAGTVESGIHYYTTGAGQWHDTKVWPPHVFESRIRFYLAADHTLSKTAPDSTSGADTYAVDFSTTNPNRSRWHMEPTDDFFNGDRSAEDSKLLVYTSAPLEADAEITGSPIVKLEVASTATDGAFFAYLEDVAPDGRVTLLNEGELRAVCRGAVNVGKLSYNSPSPVSSCFRKNAQPMIPAEPADLEFSMWPASVLLPKGDRIRMALAGADTSSFQRYPPTGDVTWTVYRHAGRVSYLDLPLHTK